MKIYEAGIVLCICSVLFFTSCAALPSSKEAIPVIPVETDTASLSVATPVPDEKPIEIQPESEIIAKPSVPEKSGVIPSVPPVEKLLYFYPEPEVVFTVPEPTAPVANPIPVLPPVKVAVVPVVPAKEVVSIPAKTPEIKPVPPKAEVNTTNAEPVLPGIWVSEAVSPAVVEQIAPIPPSRQSSVSVGQTLDVWYPGSGWVFLGDASAQNGLGYETRKLDKKDTLFTFKALKAGNYILNFSRFDVLQDVFASDSLAVTVSATGEKKTGTVRSPDYRSTERTVPDSVSSGTAAPSPSRLVSDEPSLLLPSSAVPVNTASELVLDPEQLLTQTKTALAAKDSKKAIELLDQFFSAAVASMDEGWFLRGQAYEANGPNRDVRKALSSYETLVSAYPDSARWKDADARIRYIRQFYLKIR